MRPHTLNSEIAVLGSAGSRNADVFIPDLLAKLHYRAQPLRIAAGAQLFAEDDDVDRLVMIASGWAIKSKSLIDGRRQIVDFALPGDVLGSVRGARMRHAAEMLTAGEIVSIPSTLFVALAGPNPELALQVATRFEAVEMRAYERIAAISCRSAHLRVARLLTELVERQLPPGAPTRDLRLTLPLRQIHIADALGLRIETVCRVLGQLARAEIAHLRSGRLHVADLDALRRECDRESPPPAGKAIGWSAQREPTSVPSTPLAPVAAEGDGGPVTIRT